MFEGTWRDQWWVGPGCTIQRPSWMPMNWAEHRKKAGSSWPSICFRSSITCTVWSTSWFLHKETGEGKSCKEYSLTNIAHCAAIDRRKWCSVCGMSHCRYQHYMWTTLRYYESGATSASINVKIHLFYVQLLRAKDVYCGTRSCRLSCWISNAPKLVNPQDETPLCFVYVLELLF